MGRKATKNSNLPPNMRKRVRKYGTYYYLDKGEKPRKEIPLGSDYILALKKYAELHIMPVQTQAATFGDVIDKYLVDELPRLGANTQNTYRSTIKHIREYFGTAPLDQIRPMHIKGFLDELKDIPTTANRCKRVFSTIWNHARGWGYTDLPNPCEGIKGFSLEKRLVYITDNIFELVHGHASIPLRDAMELAYLTGQRPADALQLTERDIDGGFLIIKQRKTKKPLRIEITGKLASLLERIKERKKLKPIITASLLTNSHGKRLTQPALRYQFEQARRLTIESHPDLLEQIKQFWFYDLRAKAADDTSEIRGDQAASDLLGHENVQTTRRHYLRRGKIVTPTK